MGVNLPTDYRDARPPAHRLKAGHHVAADGLLLLLSVLEHGPPEGPGRGTGARRTGLRVGLRLPALPLLRRAPGKEGTGVENGRAIQSPSKALSLGKSHEETNRERGKRKHRLKT